MPNVNRVKRTLFRAGELQDCLTPTCSQGFEVPAVEVVGPVDGTQDGFDSGGEGPEGVGAAGRNHPLELNPAGRQLTSADFQQQQVQDTQGVQGVSSARAQQVSQSESPYQGTFWKDSQDFNVPENARVEQAAQAHTAEMESRRYAELAEQQSFSLTGRQELRA